MSTYTITQLAEMSGIKPHTIRIWERRYNLLAPERTNSNIRRYDDRQLKRLLNTVTLLDNGIKISKIASFSESEINALIEKKIQEQQSNDFAAEIIINQLFTAGISYNEIDFEKAFASSVLRFGVRGTYIKIIYPLLSRAGYMWANSTLSPCQEHFMSNLLRRKLFTVLDSTSLTPATKRKWLLFLPENEFHEIGLLFAYYLIRAAGHSAIYLGQSVPYEYLKATVAEYLPTDILFFQVNRTPKETLEDFLEKMSTDFPKAAIVVSANRDEFRSSKLSKNVSQIATVEELESIL